MEAIAIIIGVIAGALGGMFGIGGGLVMVPAMAAFLHFSQHKAQGTSLGVLIIPVALPAVINYYKEGNIDLKVAAFIACGFLVGGFFGSKFSLSLPETTVKKAFAIFLVTVAVYMWIKADQKKATPPPAAPVASATTPAG